MSHDMRTLIEETSEALKTAPDDKKAELAEKLGSVLGEILKKISDFSDIPEHYFKNIEPQMTAQIQAVDKRTETAADSILGACENMGKAIKDAPDDIKKAVQNEINAIFEASGFQDLVSQHANEIRLLNDDIKADMQDLKAFTKGGSGDGSERSRDKNKRSDSHLLNGPAVPTD